MTHRESVVTGSLRLPEESVGVEADGYIRLNR